jgi:TonB family protein
LSETPNGAARAASLRKDLDVARRQAEYLANPMLASELKLLAGTAPAYPSDARARNLEGWVELEFVVDRNGRPRDLEVVQAEPPGRFDASALAAVAQYRYVPFERDGARYERRARLRVRFTLN